MRINRRKLIGAGVAGGLAAGWQGKSEGSERRRADYARLDRILKQSTEEGIV